MKNLLLSFFCISIILSANAKTAYQEIKEDIHKASNNYYAYQVTNVKYTPAPQGYEPFYLSHYGRHGSRWLIDAEAYKMPYNVLRQAQDSNVLSDYGKIVLEKLEKVYNASENRLGELTLLGAKQHQGIAERMYHNFPEIFNGNTVINAKSTVVIRCILSMSNAIQRLVALNPNLQINIDASAAEMYYMNFDDPKLHKIRKEKNSNIKNYYQTHINYSRMINSLISDPNYIEKYIDTIKFGEKMFDIATNQQSLEMDFDFDDLFTLDEYYNIWQRNNASWYSSFGPSPNTESKMPYSQRHLLENILNTADTCVKSPRCNVTLRYGHEVNLVPLTCLLGLNNYDTIIADFDKIEETWRAYDILMMAGNIQIVFYRTKNTNDDILVKFMLNEKETTLPKELTPINKYYYKWNEVENYYRKKINNYKE